MNQLNPNKIRLPQTAAALIINFQFSTINLLKGILAQAFSTQGEVLHVAGNLLAEVLVDVQLGEVLTQHEAVSTQTGEDTHLRVDNVARLGVSSGPAGEEADFAQVGNPLGKDLRDNIQELPAVVLDVLTCLVGISVG